MIRGAPDSIPEHKYFAKGDFTYGSDKTYPHSGI